MTFGSVDNDRPSGMDDTGAACMALKAGCRAVDKRRTVHPRRQRQEMGSQQLEIRDREYPLLAGHERWRFPDVGAKRRAVSPSSQS